ncbi:hypothetical protein CEXT_609221 [Caerostris extrusa]|uniref:Uncharacterized protein n=1 Tax=Caerostris extrusa TaxID=172846 RepID=A0AAV4P640_CAEEX|nr:hypothetical protein CEXT_609221 [Caerostris extrusa]
MNFEWRPGHEMKFDFGNLDTTIPCYRGKKSAREGLYGKKAVLNSWVDNEDIASSRGSEEETLGNTNTAYILNAKVSGTDPLMNGFMAF